MNEYGMIQVDVGLLDCFLYYFLCPYIRFGWLVIPVLVHKRQVYFDNTMTIDRYTSYIYSIVMEEEHYISE